MTTRASNVSFDGRPIVFHLSSPEFAVLDPMLLDAIPEELRAIGAAPAGERRERIAAEADILRIGTYEVPGFAPGVYEVGLDDFEQVSNSSSDPGVFEVDTGAVVFIDMAYLSAVAAALTWDRYDDALSSPVGDDTVWLALSDEVGGPYYGVFFADARSPFEGDGAYRLRPGTPRRWTRVRDPANKCMQPDGATRRS